MKLNHGIMQNVILSPIEIPALVNLLVSEIETRILNRQPATPIPPATEMIRLFGDKAAAQYLGCSIMTVQTLRRSGAISFYRTGRKVFYISSELDESLKVQNRKFNRKSTQV
jgi:excisionase family DNA binding protein